MQIAGPLDRRALQNAEPNAFGLERQAVPDMRPVSKRQRREQGLIDPRPNQNQVGERRQRQMVQDRGLAKAALIEAGIDETVPARCLKRAQKLSRGP